MRPQSEQVSLPEPHNPAREKERAALIKLLEAAALALARYAPGTGVAEQAQEGKGEGMGTTLEGAPRTSPRARKS